MNTPAHALINLLVLKPNGSQPRNLSIVGGAIAPDVVMFVFYFWHLIVGTPEAQIWSLEYFRPFWQAFIDIFNSIPLIVMGLLIAWKARRPILTVFFASMLLHTFGDLPLHHDDGHRHFFPFLDWRFVSPVSYWDSNHHGHWASLAELFLVLAGSIYLYLKHSNSRYWVLGIVAVYLFYWAYVVIVWM